MIETDSDQNVNHVRVGELAGVTVGAIVMLNVLIAGKQVGASMNTVKTLGPAIGANNYKATWVYLTAPFLGALLGAGTSTAVKLSEDGDNIEKPSSRSFKR